MKGRIFFQLFKVGNWLRSPSEFSTSLGRLEEIGYDHGVTFQILQPLSLSETIILMYYCHGNYYLPLHGDVLYRNFFTKVYQFLSQTTELNKGSTIYHV